MKKNLAFLSVILFMFNVCAQEPYANGAVFTTDLKKTDIYNKTLQWMAEAFVSSNQVIELKDSTQGIIIGNASVKVSVFMGQQGLVGFKLKIEIKDNKYRVTAYGYHKADNASINESWYTTNNAIKRINEKINSMMGDLTTYLLKSNTTNSNW